MAISPKMLAVLQKVDAARAEVFAGLRESAKREALLRAARKQVPNAKRKPPTKVRPVPFRATRTGGAARKPRKDRKGSPRRPRV